MTIVDFEDLRRRRCSTCGALVWDRDRHDAWHAQREAVDAAAVSLLRYIRRVGVAAAAEEVRDG